MSDSFTPEQVENFNKFFELISSVNREMDPLVKAKLEEAKRADEAAKALKTLGETLGAAGKSFGKAVFSAEPGMKKFGNSVELAGDAIDDYASKHGAAGKVIGFFAATLAKIASAAFVQNDNLMTSYQRLSDMGAGAANGLEGLQQQLARVGLTAAEAEKFEKAIQPVTKELFNLGGSVTGGRTKLVEVFGELINSSSVYERQLGRLGLTTDQMREGSAFYIQQQAKMGLLSGRTTSQLTKESVTYMTTLKQLQELTGMSRDEQQKALALQLSDARFNMYLTGLKGQERDNVQEYMLAYKQTFGEEAAAGLIDLIVSKGVPATELGIQAMLSTQGKGLQSVDIAMKGGVKEFVTALDFAATGMQTQMAPLKGTFMLLGNEAKQLYGNYDQVNGMIKMKGMSATDKLQYIEQLKKTAAITKGQNGMLENNILAEQKMRQIRILADNLLIEVTKKLTEVFYSLSKVVFKFGKTVAKVADWISDNVFHKKTNYAAAFRDEEDIDEELKALKLKTKQTHFRLIQSTEDYRASIGARTASEMDYHLETVKMNVEKLKKDSTDNTIPEEERANAVIKLESEKARLELLEGVKKVTDNFQDMEKGRAILLARLNQVTKEETTLAISSNKLKKEKKKLDESEIKEKTKLLNSGAESTPISDKAPKKQLMGYDAQGQPVSPEVAEARTSAASNLAPSAKGRENEILNNLNLKGPESAAGGAADPALLALAEKIQGAFPGVRFTALNDIFHQNLKYHSRHVEGKALDMTIPGLKDMTKEQLDSLTEQLKSMGAGRVWDEDDGEGASNGRHLHLEVAKYGGMFSGPESGYPVMLHGKEAVVPTKDLESLLASIKKDSLENIQDNMNKSSSTVSTINDNNTSDTLVGLMKILTAKMDLMVREQRNSNSIQDEILTYSRAH